MILKALEILGVIFLSILTIKLLGYCLQKIVWNIYFDKGIDQQFRTLNGRVYDLERKVGVGLGAKGEI